MPASVRKIESYTNVFNPAANIVSEWQKKKGNRTKCFNRIGFTENV